MRRNQYQREGFAPAGPGLCRCPHCRQIITTNALGRASHLRACEGLKRNPPKTGGLHAPQA